MNHIDMVMPEKGKLADSRTAYVGVAIDEITEVMRKDGGFLGHDVFVRIATTNGSSVRLQRGEFRYVDGKFTKWPRLQAVAGLRVWAERAVAKHLTRGAA